MWKGQLGFAFFLKCCWCRFDETMWRNAANRPIIGATNVFRKRNPSKPSGKRNETKKKHQHFDFLTQTRAQIPTFQLLLAPPQTCKQRTCGGPRAGRRGASRWHNVTSDSRTEGKTLSHWSKKSAASQFEEISLRQNTSQIWHIWVSTSVEKLSLTRTSEVITTRCRIFCCARALWVSCVQGFQVEISQAASAASGARRDYF